MDKLVNTEDSFARMQAIFDERERQYNEREEEFKQRRAAFATLETTLTAQKQDIEAREKAVADKEEKVSKLHLDQENAYRNKLAELENREESIKSLEEKLKKDKAAFEAEKNNAYLRVKLEEEELKNERMKVRRQAEALEYEKEMGNIGVEVIKEDLSNYVSKSEVQEHYLPKNKVEKDYISRTEHEQKVAELEQSINALQQAKTDLFRKMFGRGNDNTDTAPKQQIQEDNLMYGDEDETQDEVAKPETEHITEATRDLTADSLKETLMEHTEFQMPQIRHAESGDLIDCSIGKALKCVFVFGEPPYFDLVVERKSGKRLDELIDLLKRGYPDITFEYENGELRGTGFFLRNMSAESLIEEVKKIAGDMEEGTHGK